MKTYRCWSPDLETESEARSYDAETWKDAAEMFAMWSYNQEEFNELIVNVRFPNGALYQLEFDAEMELTLSPGLGCKLEDKRESDGSASP